jgi:hypothetical protein
MITSRLLDVLDLQIVEFSCCEGEPIGLFSATREIVTIGSIAI